MNPTTEPNAPSAHTKTPWKYHRAQPEFNVPAHITFHDRDEQDRRRITFLAVFEGAKVDNDANAAHAVRVVNSHDALVAALNAVLKWHDRIIESRFCDADLNSANNVDPWQIQAARAALALAGEEGK